ncbi:hypothetical protein ACTHAM_000692 [Cellulomonas soli]|uniref:hypothetical protein n=1 Tax=Cellulomonas soli TaxID=931535 RepID=UPI003F85C67A
MTALTAPTGPVARTARPGGPSIRTARRLLAAQLSVGRWFWAILFAAVVVLGVVLHRYAEPDASVLAQARQAGIWFPFSMHIVLATSHLAPHLAAGMTRRTYVRGAIACAVAVGALYAMLMTVGLLVERWWYLANGWTWRMQVLGVETEQVRAGLVFLDHTLTFVLATLCGLLVGAVYQARGGWWGTLMLPFTVGPILLTGGLLTVETLPTAADVVGGTPGAIAIVVLLAVIVAFAFAAVARRTAVSRPSA